MKILLLVAAVFSLLFMHTAQAAVLNCTNCTDCSSKIASASDGDVIQLNASVSNFSGTCIDFGGKDNLTFDCMGNAIDGIDIGYYGIWLGGGSNNNTVRNCTVTDFGYGIYLSYSSGNTLTNITANSSSFGLYMVYSSGSTLRNVSIQGNVYNFRVDSSSVGNYTNDIDTSNTVEWGKKIYYWVNKTQGVINSSSNAGVIYLINSTNVTIRDVNVSYGNYWGILLDMTNSSSITNATSSNNGYGISLNSSSNNTLSNVTIISNAYGGIWIYGSNNTVNDSVIEGNGGGGIYILSYYSYPNSSLYNRISNNKFNNTDNFNCYDGNNLNYWNASNSTGPNIMGGPYIGGNYWATPSHTGFSETCEDLNSDGYCDSSYTPAVNNTDYLPLAENHLLIAFASPAWNGTNTSNTWIFVNVTSNETLPWCMLDWYNGTWQNVSMTGQGKYCYVNMTGLTDGSYYFRAYANDSFGMINVTGDRLVNVDLQAPNITWNSPSNNSYTQNQDWIYWNASISESPAACLLSINGTSNVTMGISGSYCYYNSTFLSNQTTYCGRVYANDSAGNLNLSGSVCATVNVTDTSPPGLWFTSPSSNQSITGNSWIFVNISANENLNASVLNWYNGTWQNLSMSVNGIMAWINMTVLSDGSYYFRVYANDSGGNMNVTGDRQVNVDATYPVISIAFPQNGSVYSNNTLYLNFTYNESNPHTCWYYYNGSNTSLPSCQNRTFTALDNQSTIQLWMNDTAGHLNSSQPVMFSVCIESWSCSGWSACSGGTQTRACSDINSCGTSVHMPALSQSCIDVGGPGGGGGGPETPQNPEVVQSWGTISAGTKISMIISKSGLDFTGITMETAKEARNVSIKVTKLAGKPAGIADPQGKVYQYLNVNAANLNDLKSATIRFRLSKSWVTDNSIDRNRVYLNRYTDSGWWRLQTGFEKEDGENVYYYAETPGFSYFAITGEVPAPPGRCNNNGLCETGENESSCPSDCHKARQVCEAGELRCSGSLLQVCNRSLEWITVHNCSNVCLNNRCQEIEGLGSACKVQENFIRTPAGTMLLAVLLGSLAVTFIIITGRYLYRRSQMSLFRI